MKKQKRRKQPMLDHEEADCWKELRQEKEMKKQDDRTERKSLVEKKRIQSWVWISPGRKREEDWFEIWGLEGWFDDEIFEWEWWLGDDCVVWGVEWFRVLRVRWSRNENKKGGEKEIELRMREFSQGSPVYRSASQIIPTWSNGAVQGLSKQIHDGL